MPTTTTHHTRPEVQPGPDERSPGCTGSPERMAMLLALARNPMGLGLPDLVAAANATRPADQALAPGEVRRIMRMLADAGRISIQPAQGKELLYYSPAARAAERLRSAAEQARRLASALREHSSAAVD